ncbi:ECF transporter S component [Streptococcaceae bacterium ESL0729]|nr:ECF transporter S component [Streptococcaceae bacterium ESL0729]
MNIKKITFMAIYIAILVVISRLLLIPLPASSGFITLLDAGIFLAALRMSSRTDVFLIGGLAAFSLDLLAGYPQWMIFSLLIHGFQGFIAAYKPYKISFVLASAFMVLGYFLATTFIYNVPSALAGIPTNIVQNLAGIVGALALNKVIDKVGIKWI